MKVNDLVLHPAAEGLLGSFMVSPAHAVLLAGPAGNGKTQTATALAAELLAVADPVSYPYFRELRPDEGKISIEQVRELISFFRLKAPGMAKIRRAAIIQDSDCMGVEAQNALLKLLEEPPEDSVLILTSSQPQRLLTTIRSRVQLLQLPTPGTEPLMQHFMEMGYSTPAINAALLRSGTNIAEAARILAEQSEDSGSTLALVKDALGSSTYERLMIVDGLAKQKSAAADFVNTLASVAAASLESAARKGAASVERWKSVLQAAHTAESALERSGNTKLVLTELMLAI